MRNVIAGIAHLTLPYESLLVRLRSLVVPALSGALVGFYTETGLGSRAAAQVLITALGGPPAMAPLFTVAVWLVLPLAYIVLVVPLVHVEPSMERMILMRSRRLAYAWWAKVLLLVGYAGAYSVMAMGGAICTWWSLGRRVTIAIPTLDASASLFLALLSIGVVLLAATAALTRPSQIFGTVVMTLYSLGFLLDYVPTVARYLPPWLGLTLVREFSWLESTSLGLVELLIGFGGAWLLFRYRDH